MTTASAPGKIILFGEHAVVYGRPALAAPVTQLQASVQVERAAGQEIHLYAPDIGLTAALTELSADQPLAAAVRLVLQALAVGRPPGLQITIHSSIPVASGLGSGTAVSVALIRALSAELGQPLEDEKVSQLAFEVEKLHHGTPSGIDNTVITHAVPVYYLRGEPLEILAIRTAFTLVIAGSGQKALTRDTVADVRRLWQGDREKYESMFDSIGQIAARARACLLAGDWQPLGALMDRNQDLLARLTVSSPELEHLVAAARAAGALGAKLSGGGRGGNIIALAAPQDAGQVAEALRTAGAVQTIITTIS